MTTEVTAVQRAARKAALAREGLKASIRAAHAAGYSLRAIAVSAGMSHENVRRIVSSS